MPITAGSQLFLANGYSRPITAVLLLFQANSYSMLIVAVSQAMPSKQLLHADYCSFAGYSGQTPLGRLLQFYNYSRQTAVSGRLLQFYSYSQQTAVPGRLLKDVDERASTGEV